MQEMLMGLLVLLLAAGLLMMAFRPGQSPRRFVDADADGEPDETPEQKRRALETVEE